MAEETRLREIVDELNGMLGDYTPYKLDVVDPATLRPIDKNAHYMKQEMFVRLMENVKRDGNLSSVPFCWRKADGETVVLSGNHRVASAQQAGVERIIILYTDAELSNAEKRSIQIAHNSLVGEDNPQILAELWQEIDAVELKVSTGLDDDFFKKLEGEMQLFVKTVPLQYEQMVLLFIPTEVSTIVKTLEEIRRHSENSWVLVADIRQFDEFFETMLDFKEQEKVLNTNTAIAEMISTVKRALGDTR